MSAYAVADATHDHPHEQRNRSAPCRRCLTPTFRYHAACVRCVDPDEQFGCCARCAPEFFGPVTG